MNLKELTMAREEILKKLPTLTDGQQFMFRRMYQKGSGTIDKSVPIKDVVDSLPADRVRSALRQVRNTKVAP